MFLSGLILIIIVGVTAENAYEDCIYFDKESGFVALSPLPPLVPNANPVKIHMDVKAYNCDDISLTMHIGKRYKFTTQVEGSFITISDDIRKYEISNPCNGLWHNVTLDLYKGGPLLHFDEKTFYRNYEGVNFDNLWGETIYIGFNYYNKSDDEYTTFRSYDKPFEGYIRNITIDGVVQSTSQSQLNGTLVSKACPAEVIMTNIEGAAKLNDDVTFDSNNLRISFELKITNCSECCSNSSIIMSAIGEDSYFILEIVTDQLYWKLKSGDYSSYHSLTQWGGYKLCDGNWHKIAVLQQDSEHVLIADNHSDGGNIGRPQHFTAPLYVGQHPIFKLLSSIEPRNGFKGGLRSLQINGVVQEISENNLNEFAKLGSSSKVNEWRSRRNTLSHT